MSVLQGWKLQAVRLSGTGKNRAGQVKILDTCPKERLKFWTLLSVCMSRTGKNSAGQVNFFDTFPKERLKYFVISTPVLCHVSLSEHKLLHKHCGTELEQGEMY